MQVDLTNYMIYCIFMIILSTIFASRLHASYLTYTVCISKYLDYNDCCIL